MPYTVCWYQQDRIAIAVLDGLVTIDEIDHYIGDIYNMMDTGKPLVHVITDVRGLTKIENVPEALKAVKASPVHPNTGWMIVVGSLNPLVTFVVDFLGMIMKSRYRRFDTLPEAMAFLEDKDETLLIAGR